MIYIGRVITQSIIYIITIVMVPEDQEKNTYYNKTYKETRVTEV